MSAIQHTTGPWRLLRDDDRAHIIFPADNGSAIALALKPVGCAAPSITPLESEANARLIAAAPDLLDVIKRLLREDEAGEFTMGLIEDARAAFKMTEDRE